MALAAVAWLTIVPRNADLRPILNGRRFSAAEQRQAEQALHQSGVAQTRFADGQLLVPGESLAAANRALDAHTASGDASAANPSSTGSWFDQFATSRRQRNADESAKAVQLSKLLAQLSGVESAEVVWDEEPRVGRRQAPRVRATVFLKPEPGTTIGLDTIQAVRAAVSGSRAHLAADDVLVMDLQRSVTYGPASDTAGLTAELRRSELLATCRTRIESALSNFKGRIVSVSLDEAAPTTIASSPPAGHSRIAGMSGPNLRLEVARAPLNPPRAPDSAVSVEPPQLSVNVAVPVACLAEHSAANREAGDPRQRSRNARPSSEARRLLIEHEIRQRVGRALSGLPVAWNASQLTMSWNQTPAEPSVPATANTVPPAGLVDWTTLRSAARAFVLRKPLVVAPMMVAVICVSWAFIRRRRGATGIRTSHSGQQDSSAREVASIEFLPGVDSAVWAPLVALEPTPIVAGLLRRLPPDEVAQVISHLSAVQQRDVLELAPSADFGPPDVEALRRRILAAVEKTPSDSPPNDVARRPRGALPNNGRPRTSLVRPAAFDDLLGADEESLRQLAARVHAETWTAALMGASPKLQRRLSKLDLAIGRARDGIDRRPIRLREIESAQRMIVDEWQALQGHG